MSQRPAAKETHEARRQAERATQGRRARQREEQARAAQRRRLILWLGGATTAIIIVIIAVAIVLSQSSGSGSANGAALTDPNALNPDPNMLAVGSKAPDFNLATVDGKSYSLSAQRGHTVFLEFFAVWCPHCQREASVINQLEATYNAKGLRTLAVLANPYGKNYDTSQQTDLTLAGKSDISWFTTTFAVKHPTLIDPKFATVNRYAAGSYPTIYVIDPKGVIRYNGQGEIPYATLDAAIAKAMKQ